MAADQLSSGSTCGGYLIRTKKDIPVMFRVNGVYIQYSINNGVTWNDL